MALFQNGFTADTILWLLVPLMENSPHREVHFGFLQSWWAPGRTYWTEAGIKNLCINRWWQSEMKITVLYIINFCSSAQVVNLTMNGGWLINSSINSWYLLALLLIVYIDYTFKSSNSNQKPNFTWRTNWWQRRGLLSQKNNWIFDGKQLFALVLWHSKRDKIKDFCKVSQGYILNDGQWQMKDWIWHELSPSHIPPLAY